MLEYSPIKMSKTLHDNNFKFKKKFGQNFIIDQNIVESIVNRSFINKDTLVIEIGPGSGSLTNILCQKAGFVLCYEIDNTLKEVLSNSLKNYHNYEIKYIDFLKANVKQDLSQYCFEHIYVVANLPYYITTPIIMKLIEDDIDIEKIVVMVQKEVGDRFKALPHSKDYNALSVFLQYYFDIKKILDISKNVFIPKPNVDSIVVEFTKKENNIALKNKEVFLSLIKDSFKQKRKTLKNNLKDYDLSKIEEILNKYNMNLGVRAEDISLEIFIEIANNI